MMQKSEGFSHGIALAVSGPTCDYGYEVVVSRALVCATKQLDMYLVVFLVSRIAKGIIQCVISSIEIA
jgi:hypothetical protein